MYNVTWIRSQGLEGPEPISDNNKVAEIGKEVDLGTTVLIVDDNAALAYFTACNLRLDFEELEIVTAGSCEEAQAIVDDQAPSVLIADLKLPDGDGLELVRDLRRRFPSIVPILITAKPPSEDCTGELFGLLVKPYEIQTLSDLVSQALNLGDSAKGQSAGEHRRKATASRVSQHDFHQIQNRLSGLLIGIRAFGADLDAVADNPSETRRTVDEYVDRLCAMVKDVAETLKREAARK